MTPNANDKPGADSLQSRKYDQITVSVRVPEEHMAQLRIAASLQKMTILEVVEKAAEEGVREAVVAYLKKHDPDWFDPLFIPVEDPTERK